MNDPVTLTIRGVFWTLVIIAVGLVLTIIFERMKKKDLKKQQKVNQVEIDRLLSLDEHEQKIS